jgi:hypothetical protein
MCIRAEILFVYKYRLTSYICKDSKSFTPDFSLQFKPHNKLCCLLDCPRIYFVASIQGFFFAFCRGMIEV